MDSSFSNRSILIHELLTLIVLLISKRLLNPSNQTKLACRTCVKGITCAHHLSRNESFISILSHAICINNQGTKLDGINVPKYGSMVTKYFSSHSQNEGKVYVTKSITVCWWQGLHATNYGLIFCVTIMFLCSTINRDWALDRSNIF